MITELLGKPIKRVVVFFIVAIAFHSLSAPASGQQRKIVRGTVVSAEDGTPIAGARVFLVGTTIGAVSSPQGAFRLNGVPSGKYEIAAHSLGYELGKQSLLLREKDEDSLKIKLVPKPTQIGEVTVTARRPKDYRIRVREFTRFLLGNSSNGEQATLVNPDVLDFTLNIDTSGNTFYTVSAREPLVIMNPALGYKVFFYLQKAGMASKKAWYQGPIRFEELEARDSSQKLEWLQKRVKTYHGSMRHFFCTFLAHKLRFMESPNPDKTETPIAEKSMSKAGFLFRSVKSLESYFNNWLFATSQYWLDDIRVEKDSANPTVYRLYLPPYFQVIYNGRPESGYIDKFSKTAFDDGVLKHGFWSCRSLVAVEKQPVRVDVRGMLIAPDEVILHGYWSWLALADEVPLTLEKAEMEPPK